MRVLAFMLPHAAPTDARCHARRHAMTVPWLLAVCLHDGRAAYLPHSVGYLLRSMGLKQCVMVGALTDQCVESAIRDACDDNFLVTQVRTAVKRRMA